MLRAVPRFSKASLQCLANDRFRALIYDFEVSFSSKETALGVQSRLRCAALGRPSAEP